MARYGIPQRVLDEIDKGAPLVTFIEIDLPPEQGGPYYWCDRPFNYMYNGKVFSRTNPFKGLDESRSVQREEGTYAVVLSDPQRAWATRFRAGGTRGHGVVLHWLIPIPDTPPTLYKLGGFSGTTQSVRALQASDSNIRETRITIQDKMYYTVLSPGEWTTDSFQRSLDTTDDSHLIAHESRKIVIHKA